MATKQVKDLKKGDKIKSSVSDGTYVYLSWCTITDLHSVSVYNVNALKSVNNGRQELKYVVYTADSGRFKGAKYDGYLNEDGVIIVPDRLPKWKRVLKELFSN